MIKGTNIKACIKSIKSGGIVAYPTDTVYGLGVDIDDLGALKKLYALKGRDFDKPFLLNVGSLDTIYPYVESISETAKKLMQEFWPGALTIILKASDKIGEHIHKGMGTVGIRMPDHELSLKMLREYGRPLVSTSVNRSGNPPLIDPFLIEKEFENELDYLLLDNVLVNGESSTIVVVSGEEVKMLREGAVKAEKLYRYLEEN